MMIDQLSMTALSELREQLERQHETLSQQIKALEEAQGTHELRDPVYMRGFDADLGELGADRTDWDRTCAVMISLRHSLADVKHALSKLDKGTYGLCEECGRAIPERRLRRIPEARYDVEHQASQESRRRTIGRARPTV